MMEIFPALKGLYREFHKKMLKNTFCHIPGVGMRSERNIWKNNILSWEDFLNSNKLPKLRKNVFEPKAHLERSLRRLEEKDESFFNEMLPSNQLWRLFPEFRGAVAYLDIETTGYTCPEPITTIALYDGQSIFYYVKGDNLDRFIEDIGKYKVIVTFNGKCFDVPLIEAYFRVKLGQAHIDLRFVLKEAGITGGLKRCEKALGMDRKELDGVDGYSAVLLWSDYVRYGNLKSLETLLAYNILDAVNLEPLMVMAYNLLLKGTPFEETHQLILPERPLMPFSADIETIAKMNSIRMHQGV